MPNKENEGQKRIAFYIRVSTEEQRKDGYWPEMQLDWLNDMVAYRSKNDNWINKREWIYRDLACSGADLNRPQFKKMMEDAKDGKFDIIAVWKIDRLSRSLSHLLNTFESLKSYGVSFVSYKENIDFSGPIWRLSFHMFGAMAEFERETIKTRTKEWKNTSARMWNFVISSAPYGYIKEDKEKKRNRSLKVVESEEFWVKRIFEEFIFWNTYQGIAKILNENKLKKWAWNNKTDKYTKWDYTGVRNIIENPAYTGRAMYNPKNDNWEIDPVEIPVPQIITPTVYELAQQRVHRLKDDKVRGWWEKEYLLSRKVTDLETWRKYVGVSRSKDGKPSYRRKAFVLDWKRYKNIEIPWERLEQQVWHAVKQMVDRPEDLYELFCRQSVDDRNYDTYLKERDRCQRELDSMENIEVDTELDYRKWALSEDLKDKMIQKISTERVTLQNRIADLDEKLDAIVKVEWTRIALEKFKVGFQTNLENLSFEQKKFLIDVLIEDIGVTLVSSQINLQMTVKFDPNRLWDKDLVYEPKKGSSKPIDGVEKPDLCSNGATSRARTCDLLLRREAL